VSTTGAPASTGNEAPGAEHTTVVRSVPIVRVEDVRGRPVDDPGAEAASGYADHETPADH
jgi:hypothetical protein